MKILITGSAGFIGFHLSLALVKKGVTVVGLDNINDYYSVDLKFARLNELGIKRKEAAIFNEIITSSNPDFKFSFIRMNLEDRESLPLLFETQNFDVVVNLAAQAGVRYSIESPNSYVDSNVVGFLNILECCRHNSIDHLLYASSSSIYGESSKVPFSTKEKVDSPVSLYAATKKSNELMAHAYSHLFGFVTTGMRFFTVYGPWGRPDMAIYLFTDAIVNKKCLKVFNGGDMSRDFTYIDDVVNAIQLILKNGKTDLNDEIVNIGRGNPQLLESFISEIEQSIGIPAQKEYLPMQAGDVSRTWADISALESLGFEAKINLKEGVASFVNWYCDYHSIKKN